MTGGVEILKIERVIPCLAVIGSVELFLSAFELHRGHCWTSNEYRVDSAAESRHIELEVERSDEVFEGRFENCSLFFPRLSLLRFQRVGKRARKRSKDLWRGR